MENHKNNHPHNHKHNGDNHEHKQPDDDVADLDALKTAAQPQPGAGPKAEDKGTADKAGNQESGAAGKAKGPEAELQKQKQEIDELKSKNEAANDKYLRLMAEFDNFKRRTAKEYQQLVEQANEKLIKDIIEVRENFERAFKHHKEGADPASFIEGMKMIFTKLDTVLHKHGMEVYCEVGQEFSPELHDAMMKCAHVDIPEGHIAEVLEKGYKLKGKVIKHSRVIISCGKPEPESLETQGKTKDGETGDAEAVIEVSLDKNEKEKNGKKS
jgi:molecular chaperone GrpE